MQHLPRKKHGCRLSEAGTNGDVFKTARMKAAKPTSLHRRGGSPRTRARWWQAALLLLTAAGGAVFAEDLAEQHHVTAVRFWSLGSVTRIAVETDGDFQLKSDRLDNPDRLFYDLTGTRPALGSRKAMTVIPVSDRLLKQIRVAEPQRNVTRVVLDLESPVQASTSRLDNPTRLMIELRAAADNPVTTSAPVKAPPTLVEPNPAPKPAEHKPFTPPPATHPTQLIPSAPVQAQLEPPPALLGRGGPAAVPALLAVTMKPAPAGERPVADHPPAERSVTANTTAKPATAALTSSTNSTILPVPVGGAALPARRDSSGDRSMIRVLGLKIGRIVLDPGHGGHDTGTVGPEGLREKDLVLDVAQRLGRIIESRMGSEVILTRTDDTFVPLERRTEIANEAKADLFLSIHANSSPFRTAAGVETYYLNFTTSRSALDVASRENSSAQLTVYEEQELLEKIALKDKVEESKEFATRVQNALFNLSAKADARSKDRGVKKAPFVVLIGASMPSVLSEIGFVSNAHDETIMRREEYRERVAEALYKGISSYANSLSHFQVAQRHLAP